MFALFLYCNTTYGWKSSFQRKFMQIEDDDQIKSRISLIEDSLSIYYFISASSFDAHDIKNGKSEVRNYLAKYKDCIEFLDNEEEESSYDDQFHIDQESLHSQHESASSEDDEEKPIIMDRCQFPKFHYLTHVMDMIERFGSTKNFDGGINESHHKYLTKTTGSRTQGRIDLFDEQTSTNLADKIILEKASLYLKGYKSQSKINEDKSSSKMIRNGDIYVHHLSSKFTLDRNGKLKWTKTQYMFPAEVKAFLSSYLTSLSRHVSILNCFTDLVWKHQTIRSHPYFRGNEWYDWVTLRWITGDRSQREYFCPAKVLVFVEVENELHACVHSTLFDEKNMSPSKKALKIWKERGKSSVVQYWTMETEFRMVHVTSINETVFVYDDFDDKDMSNMTDIKIEVKPIELWESKHFGKK